jgi:hypothetical protein
METPNERLYRIQFPTPERPTLEASDCQYTVLDCSETGIRYRVRGTPPEIGSIVSGVLRMRRGEDVDVEGEVARIYDGEVGLRLKPPGIPLRIIIAEQLFLRKHYPSVPDLRVI